MVFFTLGVTKFVSLVAADTYSTVLTCVPRGGASSSAPLTDCGTLVTRKRKIVTIELMKKHTKQKLLRLAMLFVADALFFSLVNPNKVYAVVIIVGFALLALTIYAPIDFLLALAERIVPFSLHTKKRIALATTLVLSLLIAMQSIGQLTIKDVLAVIPLVIVLSFYFSYLSTKKA